MEKHIIAAVCLFLLIPMQCLKAENYPKISENGQEYYLYRVQKSEGFYSIGKRFKVSREDILANNPEAQEGLKLGQTLKIPVTAENSDLTTEYVASYDKAPEYSITDSGKLHTVKSKETLFGISQKYGVSVDDLLSLNPDAVNLQTGMKLRIPKKIENKNAAAQTKDELLADGDATTYGNSEASASVESNTENSVSENSDNGGESNYFPTTYYEKKKASRKRQKDAEKKQAVIISEKDGVTSTYNYDDGSIETNYADTSKNDDFSFLYADIEEPLPPKEGSRNLRVAIMLPFSLDSINRDKNMDRFVDFYRGCILAADSLKRSGMHITIDAYDIGKTSAQLGMVLSNKNLENADMIIGPAYSNQLYYVADYAKQHEKPLIVPFTNNIESISDNKYLFQIITQQKQLYNKTADRFCEEFSGKTVFIVRPDSLGITYDKRTFTDILMPKMSAAGIPYRYVANDGFQSYIDSLAQIPDTIAMDFGELSLIEKDVMVIIPTTNRAELIRLCEHLNQITAHNVSIFGFPEWDGYQLKELYQKPLYVFNSYQQDIDNKNIVAFFRKYCEMFGVPFEQSKPSFALMGYDNMMYFATAWRDAGKNFGSYLQDKSMLQMNYSFERQGRGGYVNTGVYLNLYNADGISEIK